MKSRAIYPAEPAKRIAIAIELDHAVPWHHDCYQGILRFGEQQGWSCVVDPYLVGLTGRSGIADYDGVVGRITKEVAEAARAQHIPVVNHWRNSPVDGLHSLLIDYRVGSRLIGEHLIACGFRRFAHIGLADDRISNLELGGMAEAIESHGFAQPDRMSIDNDFESTKEGVIQFRRMLTDWLGGLTEPVGVLVQVCHAGRYLAQICGEIGLRVPQDVGIVVQMGDNVTVSSVSPTLTAVDTDYTALGYESAVMLDGLMRGRADLPLVKLITPRRLIVRDSTDVFLSSDPLVTEAVRHIAEHCKSNLRVEDVAEATGTSRRTLERRFDEVLGRTVYTEISRMRTDLIRRLLTETDRPLAAIAEDCGFSSVSHFTRFFRKESGSTPGRYRKQHQADA